MIWFFPSGFLQCQLAPAEHIHDHRGRGALPGHRPAQASPARLPEASPQWQAGHLAASLLLQQRERIRFGKEWQWQWQWDRQGAGWASVRQCRWSHQSAGHQSRQWDALITCLAIRLGSFGHRRGSPLLPWFRPRLRGAVHRVRRLGLDCKCPSHTVPYISWIVGLLAFPLRSLQSLFLCPI